MKYGKIVKISMAVGFGFCAGKVLYNDCIGFINKEIRKFFKKKAKELKDNPNANEPKFLINTLIDYGYLDRDFYLNKENESDGNIE